jgi:uncharacterized protein DUF5658
MEKPEAKDGYFIDAEGVERPDRRAQPTPAVSRYSFWGGQRRGKAYSEGGERTYVDLYSHKVWIALSFFLMLNLLDAHFTLIYLQRGGSEGNPVAQSLLNAGVPFFITAKNLGIGFGVVLFCLLKNFPNARRGIMLVLTFYSVLTVYHILLYTNTANLFLAA